MSCVELNAAVNEFVRTFEGSDTPLGAAERVRSTIQTHLADQYVDRVDAEVRVGARVKQTVLRARPSAHLSATKQSIATRALELALGLGGNKPDFALPHGASLHAALEKLPHLLDEAYLETRGLA